MNRSLSRCQRCQPRCSIRIAHGSFPERLRTPPVPLELFFKTHGATSQFALLKPACRASNECRPIKFLPILLVFLGLFHHCLKFHWRPFPQREYVNFAVVVVLASPNRPGLSGSIVKQTRPFSYPRRRTIPPLDDGDSQNSRLSGFPTHLVACESPHHPRTRYFIEFEMQFLEAGASGFQDRRGPCGRKHRPRDAVGPSTKAVGACCSIVYGPLVGGWRLL